MRPVTERRFLGGVTLVEMIVAIVVAGILLALVGMFGRWQIQSYFDVSSRAELTDAADTAVRRLARELQSALPNSVRVSGTDYLEYIPIKDAGRYRAETGGGADFPLDFGISATATRFDVLGPTVAVSSTAPADQIVIYNLGISGADAYASAQNRNLPANFGDGLSQVQISAGFSFPFASPSNRFHVVGNPVTFVCDAANGVIRRHWNYGFQTNQPAPSAGLSAILVSNVDRTIHPTLGAGCAFTYTPVQRNGMVSIYIRLRANDETVHLLHQVEVLNTP